MCGEKRERENEKEKGDWRENEIIVMLKISYMNREEEYKAKSSFGRWSHKKSKNKQIYTIFCNRKLKEWS